MLTTERVGIGKVTLNRDAVKCTKILSVYGVEIDEKLVERVDLDASIFYG